ncbi:MAG: hypothetical protein UV65_C0003G0019 [Parcubacteria group bacterium GW2011_GWF2_43_11]|nr:MAG: hypothetical protein UV65_C0003G0019 [Parcubacteria group bacterium GW2011_GWF2_43_11]OFW76451.1 MAG: hypothetical protein A2201_06455 [Alicyclobacillus sp. RIFOXYA1_FULL_53_8]
MEQLEYKTIRLEFKMKSKKGLFKLGMEFLVENFDEELNELGEEGWELVSTIPLTVPSTLGGSQTGYFYCIFKRQI